MLHSLAGRAAGREVQIGAELAIGTACCCGRTGLVLPQAVSTRPRHLAGGSPACNATRLTHALHVLRGTSKSNASSKARRPVPA